MPRLSRRAISIVGIALAAGMFATTVNWSFLHPVETSGLMKIAQREFRSHWAVRNTGKTQDAFMFMENASEWADLRVAAQKWYRDVAKVRGDRTLDEFPNTLWVVRLRNPERIDSLTEVKIQAEVFVDAIDCYSEIVSEGLCPGIPHRTSREIIYLTFEEIEGQWQLVNLETRSKFYSDNQDPMLWTCLARGVESCPTKA